MAYWLLKTEPSEYSWDDLEKAGKTKWDGVSNPVAVKNLKLMQPGDEVVLYHTGNVKATVGVAQVVKPAPADGLVEIEARRRLARGMTLAEIKADPQFADSPLLRQGRLSVVPLTDRQWRRITGA